MEDEGDIQDGLDAAALTRTVADLIALFFEVGMSEAEMLDTVMRVAQNAIEKERANRLH